MVPQTKVIVNEIEVNLVTVDGKVFANSLEVAKAFEKEHKHVMRDIRQMPEDFRLSNFGLSSYINEQSKEQPMFTMTRKGFTMLAMGFTGAKAFQWKEQLIDAFDMMERELYAPKGLTTMEMIAEMATRMAKLERMEIEQSALQNRVEYEHKRANRLENNIKRTLTDIEHFTVIGFANLHGIKAGTYHSPSIGKRCGKISRDRGYVMGSVVDPKYGNIGTYHIDVLKEVFTSHLEKVVA